MARADYIFNYIRDCYDFLPGEDRNRISEIWKGFEQVTGDLVTKTIELDFNISTPRLLGFNNGRWNSFEFNDETEITRPAQFISNNDLTGGINLSVQNLLNIQVDALAPVEVNVEGADPLRTTGEEVAEALNTAHGYTLATVNDLGQIVLTTQEVGPTAQIIFLPTSDVNANGVEFIFGLDPDNLPLKFPIYPYVFSILDNRIVHIPELQDKIREDSVTAVLIEFDDYAIERDTGIIVFKELPLEIMWAKNTLINQQTPYNNFGFLLDFFDQNSEQYLESLLGLWFAFWVGPRPKNIQRALYLLFKLDTAKAPGVVISVDPTTITYLEDSPNGPTFPGDLITITVPSGLVPIVEVGQRLVRFDPFYSGILVIDNIGKPGFFEEDIGRIGVDAYLTQFASRGVSPETDESKALKTLDRNVYLAQVDSNAFVSGNINIGNAKLFLNDISPVHRNFLLQILVEVSDTFNFDEAIGLDINFDVTPNLDYNPWLEADPLILDQGELGLAGEELGLDSEVFGHHEESSIEVFHDASTTPVLVDSFDF